MVASSITPPLEEEGAEVDGMEGAKGVAVSAHSRINQSWALLCQTDGALMTLMTEK